MSRLISGIELGRWLRSVGAGEAGSGLIQFGILAPVLVILSFGILDFTLLAFDYHRATEATRRGVRTAVIEGAAVAPGAGGAAKATQCNGCKAKAAESGQPESSSDRVLRSMQAILPSIAAENVSVRYDSSGLGSDATPAGVLPLVTVELTGLRREFLLLNIFPGMPAAVDLPPFTSTLLGSGNAVSGN